MRQIARFMAVLAVLLSAAATAPAASAAGCTTSDGVRGSHVWIKSPTVIAADGRPAGKGRPAGTRLCVAPDDLVNAVYARGSAGNYIWITKRVPNLGGPTGSAGRAHADAAKSLAARYGVTLQFAATDEGGTAGYVKPSVAMLTGTYTPGGARGRGQGLIRIGNGGDNMSAAGSGNNWFRKYLLNVTRHEVAHSEIEQRCGTTKPRVALGSSVRKSTGAPVYEHVTDAYAHLYLGATTRSAGGYGYSDKWDAPRARAIHAGRCG